jgi:hypothetical protein
MGLVLGQQHDMEEEMRDGENQLADLGDAKYSVISLLRLWLKHPFDIHAQIALPTDSFRHSYYIASINIYQ